MTRRTLSLAIPVSVSLFVGASVANARPGAFFKPGETPRAGETPLPATATSGSAFSLGTLAGISILMNRDVGNYSVENNVVVQDRPETAFDRVQPAVFAIPSIALGPTGTGHTWSMILPTGVTGGSGSASPALGIGLSWGFNTRNNSDIGIACAFIWSSVKELTAAQRSSLLNHAPLPQGASTQIPSVERPSAVIGLYIAPNL